jgi:hypothetical protein
MPLQLYVLKLYSFADRDMYMRFIGGGIGHSETSPPQTRTNGDVDMDSGVEPDWEDVDTEARDELIEKQEESESGSDGSQTDGGDEEDDSDLGPEDGEGEDSEDDGFATF